MTPDDLRAVGVTLYGRWGWQTRLAEALRVHGSTVRRWLSGDAPIPGVAQVAIECLVESKRCRDASQSQDCKSSDSKN